MAEWKLKIQGINDEVKFNSSADITNVGSATLVSLNIQKEIYVPGHIETVLQIEPKTTDFGSMDYASLLDKTVTLNDGTKDVAKDYIIFECLPEFKPNGDKTTLYLTLNIYSPEHCLTLKKENNCFIAEKLANGVMEAIVSKHTDKIKTIEYGHLQRLFTASKRELIQPYLVQYEETAHDFLARIANIYGEFLYYEDGAWHMGFHGTAVPKDVQDDIKKGKYISASFKKLTSKEENGEETYHGMKEEYLETFKESDSGFGKELLKRTGFASPQGWVFNIGNWAKKANVAEILSGISLDLVKNSIKSGIKIVNSKDEWNKRYFEPFKDNPEQCTTTGGKKIVCPFSNHDAKNKFKEKFFQEVRNGEKKSTREKIHINFGTNYASFLLCDCINILSKTYTITKISTTCKTIDKSKSTYINHEIEAIPYENGNCFPPLLERKTARKIENQTAIVTANDDPSDMGRIQIRYHWQSTDTNKPFSPWIPVAQPFASNDAAIKFAPQVGDEIMIGYEYGEIERPFMIGALATKTNKLSNVENKIASIENAVPNTKYNNDFVIKSPNGHYLKFMSPNNESFMNALTNFAPIMKTWMGYFPAKWDFVTNSVKGGREFSGGISMGDAYGLVNINMSTDKRKVLISSAMGDVQIDAFTGITISAPNGNVKIEGKNVEIVAGNNLTIKSGQNIDKMRKAYRKKARWSNAAKTLGNTYVKELRKMAQVVDLTLVRTITDAIIKPVGGTMLIKSRRFLRLEAGDGTTTLPYEAYKNGSEEQKKSLAGMLKEMKVKDALDATVNLMNWYRTQFRSAYTEYTAAADEYVKQADLLKKALASFLSNGGTVKYKNTAVKGIENVEIDSKEFIRNKAKGNFDELAEVHPLLNKITVEQGNADSAKFSQAESILEEAKVQAEVLALIIKGYASVINDMKDNKNNKIYEVINITDRNNIKTLVNGEEHYDENGYKEEIGNVLTGGVATKVYTTFGDTEYLGIQKEVTVASSKKREIIIKALKELELINWITLPDEEKNAVNNNEDWLAYLDGITLNKKPKSKGDKVLEFFDVSSFKELFMGKEMLKDWQENFVYYPGAEGEILLSDTSGNTCNIQGKVVTPKPNSNFKAATDALSHI